jgi:hypothetical protein
MDSHQVNRLELDDRVRARDQEQAAGFPPVTSAKWATDRFGPPESARENGRESDRVGIEWLLFVDDVAERCRCYATIGCAECPGKIPSGREGVIRGLFEINRYENGARSAHENLHVGREPPTRSGVICAGSIGSAARLGIDWGISPQELRHPWVGDDFSPDAAEISTRGITIRSPR